VGIGFRLFSADILLMSFFLYGQVATTLDWWMAAVVSFGNIGNLGYPYPFPTAQDTLPFSGYEGFRIAAGIMDPVTLLTNIPGGKN